MPSKKPKWAVQVNQFQTSTDADGNTTVRVPIYDGSTLQGTLVWTLTGGVHRSMSVVIEQPSSADPIEFTGAWTKVV